MNKSQNIMTKRTFGFVLTLAVLTVGAFTSALVLAYPNPNSPKIAAQRQTDTRLLDKNIVASTSGQTGSSQPVTSGQSASGPVGNTNVSTESATSSAATPQQQEQTATAAPNVTQQQPSPVSPPKSSSPEQSPAKQDQSLIGGIGNTLNQLLGSLLN